MRTFFNEKLNSRDITNFVNNKDKYQISFGSGLLLVRTKGNSISWQYKYKFGNKKYVYSLGTLSKLSMTKAQELHKELYLKVEKGINVAADKQQNKSTKLDDNIEFSIAKLANFYLSNNKNLQKNITYLRRIQSLINRLLIEPIPELFNNTTIKNSKGKNITIYDFLHNIPANNLTEIEIKNFIENIKNKSTKLNIATLLLSMYKKALLYKNTTKITNNPAEIIKTTEIQFDKSQRSRIISDIELKELFALLDKSKNQTLATAIKLLFLTGVRKNELLKAKWYEFDLYNAIWELPAERSKNRKSIKIPLSNFTIELLKTLQSNNSEFVFSSLKNKKHKAVDSSTLNVYLTNLIKGNYIITKLITPHDTRRYVRTTLSKILDGSVLEKEFICERVLNHTITLPGVNNKTLTSYLIYDFFNERKIALNKLADYIINITK